MSQINLVFNLLGIERFNISETRFQSYQNLQEETSITIFGAGQVSGPKEFTRVHFGS